MGPCRLVPALGIRLCAWTPRAPPNGYAQRAAALDIKPPPPDSITMSQDQRQLGYGEQEDDSISIRPGRDANPLAFTC